MAAEKSLSASFDGVRARSRDEFRKAPGGSYAETLKKEETMPNGRPDLELPDHWQRGVRGYLDHQDRLNGRAHEVLSEVLRPVDPDLHLLAVGVLEAGKWGAATEIKVRENERKARIGAVAPGEEFSGTAPTYNGHAIRAANKGVALARGVGTRLSQAEGRIAELRDAHRKPEVEQSMAEGREALIGSAIKSNISADEFEELLTVWDEQASIFSREGAEGTIRQVERDLEGLSAARGQADRGTGPASPWPKWKRILVAAVLGVSVLSITVCLICCACLWALITVGVLCLATLSILGAAC